MTKSTYPVVFLEHGGKKYCLKVFPRGKNYWKAERDFKHESSMNIEALLVNGGQDHFIVLALEMGCGPGHIRLPSGHYFKEFNYLLTRRLEKGTLLDLLMRANHNNGKNYWFKLTIRLQRCFIKQLCSAVFYVHANYRLAHLDIKPDNIVLDD